MAAPSAANGVEAIGAKSQLVTAIKTMPVVNASMGVVTGWYGSIKESNSIMKGWFELGEKSVVTSLSIAGDIVMKSGLADKISGPLSFADSLACKVLEQVETTKLPLLKSSPQESDGYTTKMSSAIGSTIGGADRLIDQYLPEPTEQSSRSEIATVNNGDSPKQDEQATGNLNEALQARLDRSMGTTDALRAEMERHERDAEAAHDELVVAQAKFSDRERAWLDKCTNIEADNRAMTAIIAEQWRKLSASKERERASQLWFE